MHENSYRMSFRGKKTLFLSWSSKQKCMKFKLKKMILKEIAQSFISYAEESNVVLFISFCETE